MKNTILVLVLLFGLCASAFGADGRNPVMANQTLTSANTEYSYKLPPGTKKFTIQARTSDTFRFAYETGKVAGSTSPYMTVKADATYWEDNLDITSNESNTIYMATATAGLVVEILVWR